MTITKDNEYAWYKARLGGTNLEDHLSDGDIVSGRFRWRRKDKATGAALPSVGVAIWRDWGREGLVKVSYDLKTYECPEGGSNIQRLRENMPGISGGIIPNGIYMSYYKSGCTRWPDESEAGAEQRSVALAAKEDKPAPVTFTHAPDTFEGLQERLDKYGPQAETLIAKGEALDSITADIASDLKNVFGGLETTADEKRLAESMPLRKQVEAINAKWNVLVQKAKLLKSTLSIKVITPWQKKELDRLNAERDVRIEEARQNNVQVTQEMAATPKVSSGSIGRKVTPRNVTKAVIQDRAALLEAVKDHAFISEALQRIADAGITGRVPLAGVVYETNPVSS